ncbi:hypothetical protein PENSPDRAFT_313769 [Peniophora sp. CONT]|nr:hypothetical protein PENSPDRAFT_313769 [Peniophora sp. CONT]
MCALVSLLALASCVLVILFGVSPKVVLSVGAVIIVLAGLQYITIFALKLVHAARAMLARFRSNPM